MTEPSNKSPSSHPIVPVDGSTGPRLAQADTELESISAPLTRNAPTRLKVVTVAPGMPSSDPSIPSAQRKDPYVGATIDGRYRVEAVLGEGGMGVVYRCTHTIIGKKVAMKVLRADLARDAEVTERFLNEAKSASSIGNAHIIDISDFGQLPDGSTYFVMEFLTGTPLTHAVEAGPMPVVRITHIARQLAEGLSAAHAAKIVHRDLKPDNIYLIDRGTSKDFVKILDFGIAKVSTTEGGLTRAGAVFGTPHYMSPEQAAGAPVDHRGDVYSFGVILYELASGRVPFDADNFMGILTQHMYKAPVPIRALVPQPQEVPPGLEAIILKCLSKRPEHRYQSMDELVLDIDKLREGSVPGAVGEMMARSGGFNVPADYFKKAQMAAVVPATPMDVRPKSRWPMVVGIAGVLAAVGIVAAIFARSQLTKATPQPERDPAKSAAALLPPEPAAASSAPTTLDLDNLGQKQVVLAAEPLDAHVFRGDVDLGATPVVLDIPDGHVIEVEITRNGYKTEVMKLDGVIARHVVKLERIGGAAPRGGAAKPGKQEKPAEKTPTKKKGGLGGGDIVNPWD